MDGCSQIIPFVGEKYTCQSPIRSIEKGKRRQIGSTESTGTEPWQESLWFFLFVTYGGCLQLRTGGGFLDGLGEAILETETILPI
jgi:hypothetical protein